MSRSFVLAAAAVTVLFTASPARADCSMESTSIVFPAYDVYSTVPVDAIGELRYKCSSEQKNVTPTIRITFAPDSQGRFERTMTNDGDKLTYNIYLDPQRTVIWGDGSKSTLAYVAACCPVGQYATVHIYARIPAGQDVAAGPYVDSLLVNVGF